MQKALKTKAVLWPETRGVCDLSTTACYLKKSDRLIDQNDWKYTFEIHFCYDRWTKVAKPKVWKIVWNNHEVSQTLANILKFSLAILFHSVPT